MIKYIALIIAAYLLGSVCSAIIICKTMRLPDPRTGGSHNPGATNMFRLYGKKAATLTLVGDMLKGVIPMLIAHIICYPDTTPTWVVSSVGMATFLGHLYPIWFNFQGGKGVATALGVQLGLHWMIGGIIAIIWLGIKKLTGVSSVAALISMALAPIILWLIWPAYELLIMQILMSILIFWRHRTNITNLLSGTEKKN